MKVLKLNKHKAKLLKFKILETKAYCNEQNLNYLILKDLETRLKKVLHVIYRFHTANKKILFVGTPAKLNNSIKQLLKNKKHDFIPESVWVNGIVTNSKASFKYLLKKRAILDENSSKFLFNLKNQIDLIVILNEKTNLEALKESSLKTVPLIVLNSTYDLTAHSSTYKASGDYSFNQTSIRDNLFFLLLQSLLTKAERFKRKQKLTQKKVSTTRKRRLNNYK